MKGSIIGFDPDTNTGAISGYDGKRYDFAAVDWHGATRPKHGDIVDFLPDEQHAAQIYLLEPEYVRPGFWQFYFSPNGRASRSEYWLRYFVPVMLIDIVLNAISGFGAAVDSMALSAGFAFLYYIFSLATLWPGIAVLVKRIHDRDKSGWYVLLPYALLLLGGIGLIAGAVADSTGAVIAVIVIWALLLIGVMVWFFVEFGCLRGTIGANRFGPDPVRA